MCMIETIRKDVKAGYSSWSAAQRMTEVQMFTVVIFSIYMQQCQLIDAINETNNYL